MTPTDEIDGGTLRSEENSPRAGTFAELLTVSIPLIISMGSMSLMHAVDRMFLAWHSAEALAAAMPAALLNWTFLSFAFGTGLYTNSFVAQYHGAGRKDRVAASVWQGLFIASTAGVLLLVFIPLAPLIFQFVGHEPAVQSLEEDYFSVLCSGSISFLIAMVLSCYFTGRGKTRVVMWVNCSGMLVNGILDYFMVLGPEWGGLGWGIVGAAIATIIAHVINIVVYATIISRTALASGYDFRNQFRFDFELATRMIRFGFPSGFQMFVDIAGFAAFAVVVGQIGTIELAATNLALNLNSLAFVPMFGMGTAIMSLVGQRVGEGRPELAVKTTYLAFGMTAGYMLFWVVGYLLIPEFLMSPYLQFTSEEESHAIRETTVLLLKFVAVYAVFDGLAIVFGNAIRGAGDTNFPMILMTISSGLFLVAPMIVISVYRIDNLQLCWLAATLYIVVIGVGFLWRFLAGYWKQMTVMELDALPQSSPAAAPEVDSPADVLASVFTPRCDSDVTSRMDGDVKGDHSSTENDATATEPSELPR